MEIRHVHRLYMYGIVVIRPKGVLDCGVGGDEVKNLISKEMDDGLRKFIVDLRDVSAGCNPLGEIMGWLGRAKKGGGNLVLINLKPKTQRQLDNSQLQKEGIIKVFEGEEEATDYLML